MFLFIICFELNYYLVTLLLWEGEQGEKVCCVLFCCYAIRCDLQTEKSLCLKSHTWICWAVWKPCIGTSSCQLRFCHIMTQRTLTITYTFLGGSVSEACSLQSSLDDDTDDRTVRRIAGVLRQWLSREEMWWVQTQLELNRKVPQCPVSVKALCVLMGPCPLIPSQLFTFPAHTGTTASSVSPGVNRGGVGIRRGTLVKPVNRLISTMSVQVGTESFQRRSLEYIQRFSKSCMCFR